MIYETLKLFTKFVSSAIHMFHMSITAQQTAVHLQNTTEYRNSDSENGWGLR
jgi:hypothetical protein